MLAQVRMLSVLGVVVAAAGVAAGGRIVENAGNVSEVWAADAAGRIWVLDPAGPRGWPGEAWFFESGLDEPITAIAQVNDEVWVAAGDHGAVAAFDPAQRRLLRRFNLFDVLSASITAMTQLGDELWLSTGYAVSRYTLDGSCLADAWWTAGRVAGVSRLDDHVWIADEAADVLVGVPAAAGAAGGTKPLPAGEPVTALAVVGTYARGTPGDFDPDGCPCGGASYYVDVALWLARGGSTITCLSPDGDDAVGYDPFAGVFDPPAAITALGHVEWFDPCVAVFRIFAIDDGDIDLDDFMILKTHFGMTEGVTPEMGDVNADGAVNLDDFALFKQCFGRGIVPEPSTALLLAAAGTAALRRRRG